MSRPSNPSGWAELPLVAVSIATVIGFVRVYDGWSFLVPLLAFALGAHLVAIAARRARLGAPIVILLATGGAAVAAAWILFPATTRFALPTADTWQAASEALRIARMQYPTVIAPTEVLPGFQLAAGLALWVAAWFGDWAAHRLRATAEAVTATTAIFIFTAVLGSGTGQVLCAALFGASVLVFVTVQRSAATSPAILRPAAALAGLALLVGVMVGTALPGAASDSLVRWRGSSGADASRITISPMVELRKRLVRQSDQEAFRVRASQPAYWRMTSLDSFDGEIWSSSGTFTQAGSELPSDAPTSAASTPITQRVTIKDLSTIWAPAAFEAVSVSDAEDPLRWDPDSSTLIVDASKATSDGLTYNVVSQVPEFDPADLYAVDRINDPASISSRYLGLPSDFPFLASDLARQATADASSRYDQALALQNWFRSEFRYSLAPDDGHGDAALESFLRSGEGYCEQFAGAYAAMARSLGMPARVAVGFTPGIAQPDDPDLYRVYGRQAHAWPEVYFPSVGWVAFEPTPGRGMPGAEGYTGVAAAQDATPAAGTPTTTEPEATTTPAEDQPATTRPPATLQAQTEGDAPVTDPDAGRTDRQGVAVIALIVAVAALSAVVLLRRRRATRQPPNLSRGDLVWARVTAAIERRGDITINPAETPLEVAARVTDGSAALNRVAELVTAARWSPGGLDIESSEELDHLADAVVRELETTEALA